MICLKTTKAGGERQPVAAKKAFHVPHVPRHEAIWLDGRVPSGYWDRLENRRRYVRWLGQKLGFRKPEDWYRITTDDFKRNAGGGLLEQHWSSSAIGAVKECFPDYDWKDWLFRMTPRHFWQDRKNHQQYMNWLGQELGIRDPAGWYQVSNRDFQNNCGGAFMLHYDSTVSAAIMSYLPEYDWTEWRFDKTPKGFWLKKQNRKRYLIWLARQLGYKKLDDWYAVTGEEFFANCGNQFLKFYGGSPLAALSDCFPEHTWHEWMFARVPVGFWDQLKNRKRYIRWLGSQLGIRKTKDWLQVRRSDFLVNFGGGLLARYHSYFDVLRECIPDVDWAAAEQARGHRLEHAGRRPHSVPRTRSKAATRRAQRESAHRRRNGRASVGSRRHGTRVTAGK